MQPNWIPADRFNTSFQKIAAHTMRQRDGWGNSYFHASDASQCTRRLVYRTLESQCPDLASQWDTQPRRFDEEMTLFLGHAIHDRLQRLFMGTLVAELAWCTEDDIEVPITLPDMNFKGSIDAVISVERYKELCELLGTEPEEIQGTHFILDIKTKREDTEVSRRNGGKVRTSSFPGDVVRYRSKAYQVQMNAYLGSIDRVPHLKERYPNVTTAIVLHVCKNSGDCYTVRVEKDEELINQIFDKAGRVKQYLMSGELPPREYSQNEGTCRGYLINDEYRYGCPYYNVCYAK